MNLRLTFDVADQIAPAIPASTVVIKSRERTVKRPPLPHEHLVVIDERPGARTCRAPYVPTLLQEYLDSGRETIDVLPIACVHNKVAIVGVHAKPAVRPPDSWLDGHVAVRVAAVDAKIRRRHVATSSS